MLHNARSEDGQNAAYSKDYNRIIQRPELSIKTGKACHLSFFVTRLNCNHATSPTMCVLEQAYQAAWYKKSRAAAPRRPFVQCVPPAQSPPTDFPPVRPLGPWRCDRQMFRQWAAKIRLATTSVHFRQRYGYMQHPHCRTVAATATGSPPEKQTAHESHRSGRRSHMQRREEARQSHVQAAEQNASLNQSMNSSVTATTFSPGRKIFNNISGYSANTPYSRHEPDTEDHAQRQARGIGGRGRSSAPVAYQRRQGVTDVDTEAPNHAA